jgi:hypothetical protein
MENVQHYKKLYQIEADALSYLDDDILEKFILQGAINWNLYLTKKDNNHNFETLENVQIIEFKNQKNMDKYIKKLPKELFIDYSIEDNFFYVVNYEKN